MRSAGFETTTLSVYRYVSYYSFTFNLVLQPALCIAIIGGWVFFSKYLNSAILLHQKISIFEIKSFCEIVHLLLAENFSYVVDAFILFLNLSEFILT